MQNTRGGLLYIIDPKVMRIVDARQENAVLATRDRFAFIQQHPNSHIFEVRYHARDDDRINVLPNRVQALEDWRALLIWVELRKFILVASQFFEFLHRCAGRPARSRWCKSTAMKE